MESWEPRLLWQNFHLGTELDIAGAYIYNGVRYLESVKSLRNTSDIFEILYSLSVGLERLLKIAIILIESESYSNLEELEKSLITHNTASLVDRLKSHGELLTLGSPHNDLISLLSKFYKSHRYGRYSSSSWSKIFEERSLFLGFLNKHLKEEFDIQDEYQHFPNNDRIRKFVGKLLKKIIDPIFKRISEQADKLNIYTNEIRGDSKAVKVFLGKRLDFIWERHLRKEILLYLMSSPKGNKHLEELKNFEVLDIDEEMTPRYIEVVLDDSELPFVADCVEEVLLEGKNFKERFDLLSLIDSPYLVQDEDDV